MKDTVLVDLDGTLANIDHRLHFVKQAKPDWDAFYNACDEDTPNEWCVKLIYAMQNVGCRILIVSARSKVVEEKTKSWLSKHLGMMVDLDRRIVNYDELIMLREVGDYTPDVDLKMRWLATQDKERILFVVDDRKRLVDAWRREGLVCLQAYSWPERK